MGTEQAVYPLEACFVQMPSQACVGGIRARCGNVIGMQPFCNTEAVYLHLEKQTTDKCLTIKTIRKMGTKMLLLGLALGSLCACQTTPQGSFLKFSGKVTDESGKGIANVVVNDGIRFTQTDAQGAWTLLSDTVTSKFVTISTPADYCLPQTDGLADGFYVSAQQLASNDGRHDFVLRKRDKQADNFYFVAVSDPQVRNESDMKRWKQEAVPDLKETIDSLRQTREVVGMTLGDLVFDNMKLYPEYKASVENTGATFFQCIGNHDFDKRYQDLHNMAEGTPVYGEMMYHKFFGPTDYSFNIGQIHYVVLDDIECMNDGTGEDTEYNVRLTSEQIAWLKQDLAHVDKSSTLVLATHSQIHSKTGGQVLKNYDDLMIAIDDFKDVHIFTGHTHLVYNWEVDGFYDNILEHNAGAICATWWWSGKHSGIHVCQDGAPGGYTIVDVNGSGLKWQYKGIGKDTDFQFRTYDGNEVLITEDDCRGQASAKQGFIDNYVDNPYDWSQKRTDNAVFINVWNWDPDWKVEVTENGRKLNVEKVSLRDPLHLVAYTGKSMAGTSKTDVFATSVNEHFFRVYASAPNTTLEITVTDRFGNIYTETMERPKTFSIENYK